jgi:uncharacterized protein (TIGR02231 family)
MKSLKAFFCAIVLLAMIHPANANEPRKVSSGIDKVTVFLQGAQVVRSGKVNVPAGTTDLIFEGVSPNLNTNSLQAGGQGNFVIMSVRYHTQYTPPGTKKSDAVPETLKRKIELTQDSLQNLDMEIELVNYTLQAWTTEKNMLERNKLITGEGKTDSLTLFMQAMEYYRKKIHEINQKIVEVKTQQRGLARKKADINVRLNDLLRYKGQLEQENITQASYSYQVIVTVSAKAATSGTVAINYLVNNASWVPMYELRADNSSSPVNLHYRASITQSTGEDWNNVKLVLSTQNPNRQHAKPLLRPWILRYFVPQQTLTQATNFAMVVTDGVRVAAEDESASKSQSARGARPMPPAQSMADYTSQSVNFSNVEFETELPYTIPADGKAHQVTLMEEKIDAGYKHYIVPKAETEAFLMARLTGWESLNLLPGNANIYFQNTIIGATHIDPNSLNDTLNISMGRDPGLTVTRKKLKDRETTKMLSNNFEKEIVIEITVRNKKNESVDVQVEDQIPVSGEPDVKVRYSKESVSGAEINEQTGSLTWNFKLAPRETKKITLTYVIVYPKDKDLKLN